MLGTNKTPLFLSIGSIILGVLIFIFPNDIMNYIFEIFGALIFVFGLVSLIVVINEHKKNIEEIRPLILIDIFIMLFGVIFTTVAWLVVNVFIVILGLTFILIGLWGTYIGILDPSLDVLSRVLKLLVAVFDIIIGVFFIIHIGVAQEWIMYILGSLLVINGICDLISYLKLEKEIKTYQNEQSKIDAIDVDAIDIESNIQE